MSVRVSSRPDCAMDSMMRESFLRDGYLTVPGALSAAHVAALNEEYSRRVASEVPAHNQRGTPLLWHGFAKPRGPRRLWSKAYYELVDPPAVAPILAELLSDPAFGHATPGVRQGATERGFRGLT